jgi:hypothetical protein
VGYFCELFFAPQIFPQIKTTHDGTLLIFTDDTLGILWLKEQML